MALRALLLSADVQAVPAARQVLQELDFVFEHNDDLSAGAAMLAEERFDAILVDCDDRKQDAAPVFAAVRGSAANKSSILIAIVEGKTGVPNAFHLGAMLVLTKPLALEQARSTLRTAQGMSRKDAQAGKNILARAAAAGQGSAAAPARPVIVHQEESAEEAATLPHATSVSRAPAPVLSAAAASAPAPSEISEPERALATSSEVELVDSAESGSLSLEDDPIMSELEEAEKALVAPPPKPAIKKAASLNRTPLLAAVGIVLVMAIGYGAWGMVPQFRDLVMSGYQKVQGMILRTKPPAAPAAPARVSMPPHPPAAATGQAVTTTPVQNGGQDKDTVLVSSSAATSKAAALDPVVLSAAEADARLVDKIDPSYPAAARQINLHGSVMLQATVDKDGDVDLVKVVNGNELLIPVAVEAVRQWRYKPYLRNGQPLPFITQVTVTF